MADAPKHIKEPSLAPRGWRRLWLSRKPPSQEEIKAKAYFFSKIAPWRTPVENWEQAERELLNPGLLTPLKTFWRWSGFGEKSDRKGLDAWISLSIPVLLFVGSLLFNNWNGLRQSNMASEEKTTGGIHFKNVMKYEKIYVLLLNASIYSCNPSLIKFWAGSNVASFLEYPFHHTL